MKLITLNIWGGHVREPLLDFIKKHQGIDVFCFQEMYHNAPSKISKEERKVSLNIFSELQELLPKHQGFFRPTVENVYGIGAFVKKSIAVLGEGDVSIHENPNYVGLGPAHSRNLQWLNCNIEGKNYFIINVHGLWNGMGKTDTPERIAQSQKIRNFMDAANAPVIVCGDFNLRPDTESLKIVERGMKNLVQLYGITSTRTSLYPKEERFADYIFTSPEVMINHFEVLPDEVSDHSALLIDFKLPE